MALVSLMIGTKPATNEMMRMATEDHLIVDEWFLIPGGIGIVYCEEGIADHKEACRRLRSQATGSGNNPQ